MILYHSGHATPGMDDEVAALVPEQDVRDDRTLLVLRGRPRLVSYADVLRGMFQPESLPGMQRAHRRLILDSGAFTMQQGGDPITVEQYSTFLLRWESYFDFVTNLDIIEGDDSHLGSADNQARLEHLGHKPLPVFHVNEPWEALDKMAERYDYLGLGGLVGWAGKTAQKKAWLTEAFGVVAGRCKVHGYGVTAHGLINAYPWASVDSTAWLAAIRFGNFPPFRTGVYTYAARVLPWLDYLDAMAAALNEDYGHLENGHAQGGLFGAIHIDRKRAFDTPLQGLGPIEAAWPRRLPLEWPSPRIRALLVGWAPSPYTDPFEPLSGGEKDILSKLLGMSVPEFFDRVPRAYLVHEPVDHETGDGLFVTEDAAKEAAALLERSARTGVPLVALGGRAGAALGVDGEAWLTWFTTGGAKVAVSPHPVGNAGWFKDELNYAHAEGFYAQLANELEVDN